MPARLPLSALLLGLALGCAGDAPPRGAILISIDTLRPDHLGCYGYPRATSPVLDALAVEGVLFEDVTSSSPWTLPAHASLFTGLYPARHAVRGRDQRLRDELPTLAGLLAQAGFRTAAVVNSHNFSQRYGLTRGFERVAYVSEWSDPNAPGRRVVNRGERITDRALAFLDAMGGERFFLFLHYYDVHSDYAPDPEYRVRFERPYEGDVDGSNRGLVRLRDRGVSPGPDDVRHLVDLYDGEIRQLDAQIGRLLRELRSRGMDRDTLLVVTSDHGEEFAERGSVLHGRSYYQEVIAVPLLLRGPGVPRGLRVDAPVSLVDVAPTLLARLGVRPPPDLDGRDLAPLWSGEVPAPRVLFAEADHNHPVGPDVGRMARLDGHKLILDRSSGSVQLFDLGADPGEQSDVAGQRPERSAELMEALRELEARSGAAQAIPPVSPEEQQRLRELGYLR